MTPSNSIVKVSIVEINDKITGLVDIQPGDMDARMVLVVAMVAIAEMLTTYEYCDCELCKTFAQFAANVDKTYMEIFEPKNSAIN